MSRDNDTERGSGDAPDRDPSPRQPLSRRRVLAAAMKMADEGGVEALSMRHLASQLGVQAMSLYNHVRNKDDIIAGIVDEVVGEIDIPRIAAPWKPEMRRRALSAHRVLVVHPWATICLVSGKNAGLNMLRYVNATIGCLSRAGCTYEISDRIWNAMDSYIYGYTVQELNFPFESSEYANVAREYLPTIPADAYPYFVALTEEVMAGRMSGIHEFEFGFDLLLNGLERYMVNELQSKQEDTT